MVNQPLIIAAVGVAGAVAVNVVLLQQEVDEPQPKQASAATQAPAPKDAATAEAQVAARTSTTAPKPAAATSVIAPSFDVVRINPKGDTVMAGRAEPLSNVSILEDGKSIGEVRADARGEWVFIPSRPLAPGNRQLSLSAVGADGTPRLSDSMVMLLVPKSGQDLAGKPTAEQRQAMILKLPGQAAKARADATQAAKDKVRANDTSTTQTTRVLQRPTTTTSKMTTRFTVDVVDYDDHGNLSIGGIATAAARVNLYLDGEFLGHATADADGYWALTPARRVTPGLYTLRADRTDDAGKVVARISLPFSRAENLTSMAEGTYVIVQPGNSLWRLARRAYGSGFSYSVIFAANKSEIVDPDMIFPGQVFRLPQTN